MVATQSSRAAVALIGRIGLSRWQARLAELRRLTGGSERVGRAVAQRHAVEVALERLRRGQAAGAMDAAVGALAGAAVILGEALADDGQKRFADALERALSGTGTLVGLFHLLRVAALHRAQGFEVSFAGFSEGAEFDLLIERGGSDAEIACDVVSAEEGRDVHRAAWVRLVDAIDPDLQTWLAQHPGRYLLKLTLNQGLREEPDSLAAMQERIRALIGSRRRADQDQAAILRLDPLMMAAAGEGALMSTLRREFGHEAHLAVMTGGEGVCVMAARAGREDEVADAIRRRMAAIAPQRLTGQRPGILAMLVEDTDAIEWRHLREQLEIEGAARKFLTEPAARHVVAVTCASRRELFGASEPVADLRFRNPGHPAARSAELAGAIVSSA
jgi:hypothetical protein